MKKQVLGIIKQIDVIVNSANKLNSSMEEVNRGTGIRRSKKLYKRSDNKIVVEESLI